MLCFFVSIERLCRVLSNGLNGCLARMRTFGFCCMPRQRPRTMPCVTCSQVAQCGLEDVVSTGVCKPQSSVHEPMMGNISIALFVHLFACLMFVV